jgi:hypothetical protein
MPNSIVYRLKPDCNEHAIKRTKHNSLTIIIIY